MAKSRSKKIATKSQGGALEAPPSFMQGHEHEGLEMLGAGDFEVPRIKLMQALSPELEERDDVKQGEFFHSIAEVPLGSELVVVPIFVDQRYILWRPREDGGGILARADDGIHWEPPNGEFEVTIGEGKGARKVTWRTAKTVRESGLAEWGTSDPEDSTSEPAATLMYNVVVALPDYPDLSPAVVTLQRTSIRVARRFLGKINISRAPSYGMRFKMSSTTDQNSIAQKFQNFKFVGDGFVADQQEFNRYQEMYEFFKEQGVKVRDLEDAQDDASPGGEDTEGEGPKDEPNY